MRALALVVLLVLAALGVWLLVLVASFSRSDENVDEYSVTGI